jgi:hypothetical protein
VNITEDQIKVGVAAYNAWAEVAFELPVSTEGMRRAAKAMFAGYELAPFVLTDEERRAHQKTQGQFDHGAAQPDLAYDTVHMSRAMALVRALDRACKTLVPKHVEQTSAPKPEDYSEEQATAAYNAHHVMSMCPPLLRMRHALAAASVPAQPEHPGLRKRLEGAYEQLEALEAKAAELEAKLAAQPAVEPLSDFIRAQSELLVEKGNSYSCVGQELLRRCPKPAPVEQTPEDLANNVARLLNMPHYDHSESLTKLVAMAKRTP